MPAFIVRDQDDESGKEEGPLIVLRFRDADLPEPPLHPLLIQHCAPLLAATTSQDRRLPVFSHRAFPLGTFFSAARSPMVLPSSHVVRGPFFSQKEVRRYAKSHCSRYLPFLLRRPSFSSKMPCSFFLQQSARDRLPTLFSPVDEMAPPSFWDKDPLAANGVNQSVDC